MLISIYLVFENVLEGIRSKFLKCRLYRYNLSFENNRKVTDMVFSSKIINNDSLNLHQFVNFFISPRELRYRFFSTYHSNVQNPLNSQVHVVQCGWEILLLQNLNLDFFFQSKNKIKCILKQLFTFTFINYSNL